MGADSGSRASTEPASRLGPSGFDPERRERPSQHGAILGEALADLAKAGGVGDALLSLMCATCAFREGCMTNQMAATGSIAFKCLTGEDKSDFACHHGMKDGQPTKLCAGFLAAKQAPFDVFKSVVGTVVARLDNLSAADAVRERFDAWAAVNDPDDTMDDYERSRLYSKAIATEAQRATTVEQGVIHEGAGPEDIAQPSELNT